MLRRILLVIALAVVVGFGTMKVFESGNTARQAAESGEQLDAALAANTSPADGERWYDHPTTIGLMAGGAVFVVGVVLAAVVKPPTAEPPPHRP